MAQMIKEYRAFVVRTFRKWRFSLHFPGQHGVKYSCMYYNIQVLKMCSSHMEKHVKNAWVFGPTNDKGMELESVKIQQE